MKRSIFGLFFAGLFASTSWAQESLDLASQAMLRRVRMAKQEQLCTPKVKLLQREQAFPAAGQPMVAMVRLQDDATAADLEHDGFEVKTLRGGFAVVTCKADDARRLAAHKSVRRCEFNRQRSFHMDKARAVSGVDALHQGLALPQLYTGKGVIAGIVDGGFDPNHINFKNSFGLSRFKYFSTVEINTTGSSIRITPYDVLQLSRFTTDDNTQTHGTHTLGIMAGSFKGEATVGTYDEATHRPNVATMANPYYGVAHESTLYASSGASYDALIAYAVDGILEHRWNNDYDRPIVINLSLGGNNGPHDGSGILTQYLDTVSVMDRAIICLSSGNEGDRPIAYHKTLAVNDTTFATFIRPYVYTDLRYGMVEFYSDSADDFDVSVIIYNKARKKIARTFPLNNKEGRIQYICSDAQHQQDESDIIDATFAKAYSGYVGVGGMLDSESGRFYAAIDYYVENSDGNPADPQTTEAQYTLGFLVTGKPGQRIDCFCDGTFTALDSYGYEGFVDGMRNGSISDIATGRHTITVGAYNTKERAGSIYGHELGYDGYYKEGEVTEYSSFGTLMDGRNLPHLVAPGCLIVSSMSTPYYKNATNGISDQITSVRYTDSKRDHYFYPMMGTSMASPFVAGTVALMLEADPTLTYDRVRDILMQTATMDDAVEKIEDPVQLGAGKLNAYEAMKKVLEGVSAIEDVSDTDACRPLFAATGHRTFRVFMAGMQQMDVTLCSLSGIQALNVHAQGNEANVDASRLAPGIYVLTINGRHSQKIVIK